MKKLFAITLTLINIAAYSMEKKKKGPLDNTARIQISKLQSNFANFAPITNANPEGTIVAYYHTGQRRTDALITKNDGSIIRVYVEDDWRPVTELSITDVQATKRHFEELDRFAMNLANDEPLRGKLIKLPLNI